MRPARGTSFKGDGRTHAGAAVLILLAALALVAPAAAHGQSPAICDEYSNLPVCNAEAGGGGSGDPTGNNPVENETDAGTAVPVGADSGGGAGGTGSGGELPFTGYPLTPLLLLLLLLLLIGLAIRAAIALHDRLKERGGAALPPPA